MQTTAMNTVDQRVLRDNEGMEPLEYVEGLTEKTVTVLRQSYDDLHERAYKLATVLVGGAGAAGAYALGKMGGTSAAVVWAPLAALALSWLGVAALLVWRGATSRVLSTGIGPRNPLGYFDERLVESGVPAVAMEQTRRAELALQQTRIDEYNRGCTERALAIDLAYKSAAICSALVPAIVAGFCLWIA